VMGVTCPVSNKQNCWNVAFTLLQASAMPCCKLAAGAGHALDVFPCDCILFAWVKETLWGSADAINRSDTASLHHLSTESYSAVIFCVPHQWEKFDSLVNDCIAYRTECECVVTCLITYKKLLKCLSYVCIIYCK
jgi:hypothetical protein